VSHVHSHLGHRPTDDLDLFTLQQAAFERSRFVVLSRGEEGLVVEQDHIVVDRIDVMLLEGAGHPVEAALPAARAKDGGCTPATLAWLLSEVKVPDGIELPAGVPPADLRAYLTDLIRRLLVLAAPEEPGQP
jgi:hypothetical protein